MTERCPRCGAVIERHLDRDGDLHETDPGVLYEERDAPEAVRMISLSGVLCKGCPVFSNSGARIGFRLHVCGQPPSFTRVECDEEVPW